MFRVANISNFLDLLDIPIFSFSHLLSAHLPLVSPSLRHFLPLFILKIYAIETCIPLVSDGS